jgi:hypothetical protein
MDSVQGRVPDDYRKRLLNSISNKRETLLELGARWALVVREHDQCHRCIGGSNATPLRRKCRESLKCSLLLRDVCPARNAGEKSAANTYRDNRHCD